MEKKIGDNRSFTAAFVYAYMKLSAQYLSLKCLLYNVHTYNPTTSHRCCYQFAFVIVVVVVALLSNHRTIERGGNIRFIAIGEIFCDIGDKRQE